MRCVRLVAVAVAAAAFAVHPSASALESPTAEVIGPVAPQRACIAEAQAEGAAPKSAASSCLGSGWAVTPMTSSAGALAVSCVQAVQTPSLFLPGVISWGTLVICDKPMVSAFSGTLAVNGTPYDAKAGIGTLPGSSVQFWTTYSACALNAIYQSTVLLGVIVSTSGDVAIMGTASSSATYITCI